MLTKRLLATCLSVFSVLFVSCSSTELNRHIPDRPEGWSCTYRFDASNSPYALVQKLRQTNDPDEINEIVRKIKNLKEDTTQFVCNGLRATNTQKRFHFADPIMQKSRAMPLETAERYDTYLRTKLSQRCQ